MIFSENCHFSCFIRINDCRKRKQPPSNSKFSRLSPPQNSKYLPYQPPVFSIIHRNLIPPSSLELKPHTLHRPDTQYLMQMQSRRSCIDLILPAFKAAKCFRNNTGTLRIQKRIFPNNDRPLTQTLTSFTARLLKIVSFCP